MPKYVALLRAINVGGHIVKMDALRRLFEDLGLKNVETFIASGNVIFESPRKALGLEKSVEAHLRASLGYDVDTFLRTLAELAVVAAHEPFGARGDRPLYVAFLRNEVDDQTTSKILSFRSACDDFAVHGREVYWTTAGPMSDSKFSNAVMERALKTRATFRNVTTVSKLAAKYGM